MVAFGRHQLQVKLGSATLDTLLTDDAQIALERDLLRRLEGVCIPTLHHEFWLQRMWQPPLLALLEPEALSEPEDESSRDGYIQFVYQLLQPEGLWRFFETYSALARLVVETIETWVDVVREFLGRLAADLKAIRNTFATPVQRVERLRAGLSDPHHGGRTVFEVAFDTDLQLIYKPHSLALEQAYQDVVSWVNARSGQLPLMILRLLTRPTHGWVAVVPHQPCQTELEVTRYFTRTGMLMAVLYVLSGRDFHFENLIACGEHPVPVDLEMLFSAPIATELGVVSGTSASACGASALHASVLDSGLLPVGHPQQNGGFDGSALGSAAAPPALPRSVWQHVNTDRMALQREPMTMNWATRPHVVCRGETIQHAHDHLPAILAGFENMYRFLVRQRDRLLASDGPLSAFRALPTRFVFRPTRIYGRVLETSLAPRLLHEGVDRSIHLEHLGRVHGRDDLGIQRFWPLLREEIEALTRTDIPLFSLSTSGQDLMTAAGATIADCFVQSGEACVRDILVKLSETDLQRQLTYIRLALYTKQFRPPSAGAHRAPTRSASPRPQLAAPLTASALLAEAERIAGKLMHMALYDGHRAHWVALQVDVDSERYYLDFVGNDLYQGSTGIALFFAALWQHTRRPEHRAFAQASLDDMRQRLHQGHGASLLTMGIGGATGLGALIYGLARVSAWLDDAALLTDAQALAALLTDEQIDQDRQCDVIAGAAGAILGLLALYQATPHAAVLERAIACGRHLVAHQVASEHGGRAWATLDDKLLTGFSHGAAGIAYALLKLYDATGDAAFLQAAQDGMAYEHSVFVPEAGNWPDFRHEHSFMTSWCHGAPGVALARLGGHPILCHAAIEQDIARGLDTTLRTVNHAASDALGYLCCGHLGRAEILHRGGELLANQAMQQAGRDLVLAVVHAAQQPGSYTLLPGSPPDAAPPGFFLGLAGIGYTCLRFAQHDGERLPLVLLWE